MLKQFIYGKLDAKAHLQLFKTLLLVSNTAALIIYSALHLIFFDFPFETVDELMILRKLFLTASSFAAAISLLLLVADAVDYFSKFRKVIAFPTYVKAFSVAVVALIVFLSACSSQVSVGIKKDFNTGLSSSYSNMEPEKVFLVMNNEVLNHTDIPLGESFLLVNDGIKGMQVKNVKVTIGCSLQITDSIGKILLSEKDLFAGHDIFDEKDAKMLKCTVSTGESMKWEEKYNVAVNFWDKNGNGKIENKVTIRMIDLP